MSPQLSHIDKGNNIRGKKYIFKFLFNFDFSQKFFKVIFFGFRRFQKLVLICNMKSQNLSADKSYRAQILA